MPYNVIVPVSDMFAAGFAVAHAPHAPSAVTTHCSDQHPPPCMRVAAVHDVWCHDCQCRITTPCQVHCSDRPHMCMCVSLIRVTWRMSAQHHAGRSACHEIHRPQFHNQMTHSQIANTPNHTTAAYIVKSHITHADATSHSTAARPHSVHSNTLNFTSRFRCGNTR